MSERMYVSASKTERQPRYFKVTEELGDWAESVEESDQPTLQQNRENEGLTLKQKAAIATAGLTAAAGVIGVTEHYNPDAVEGVKDSFVEAGEHFERSFVSEEQKIRSIIENSDIIKSDIQAGYGLDQLLNQTGWEDTYNNDTLTAATRSLEENKGVNFNNLHPGVDVYIPVKKVN